MSALCAEESTSMLVGVGPYFQTQPYDGVAPKILPSPVVFFDNHLFYARWTRVGIYLAGSAKEDFSWGLSLTAQPEPFGYKSSDSTKLSGMQDRDTSFEAGAALDIEYKSHFFNLIFLQDIANKSNSYIARAEAGEHIAYNSWDFYPSVMLIYHAKKFNQYYYGVNPSETTQSRESYTPTASLDYSFQSYAKYNINPKWSTLLNFRADYLDKTEQNSPIVKEKYMLSGLISLLYKFTF